MLINLLARQPTRFNLFLYPVNGLPYFVRKYKKSWLTQGGLGRQVTFIPRITFLHNI